MLDNQIARTFISTHAPRTGSDDRADAGERPRKRFQPTLPARGATPLMRPWRFMEQFQPTLPARGATNLTADSVTKREYFNPRSPHGERRAVPGKPVPFGTISTHAPRTGSDACPPSAAAPTAYFNPRSPHGERRRVQRVHDRLLRISTHAPRTGSDADAAAEVQAAFAISTHAPRTGSDDIITAGRDDACDFNPRSPHGERLVVIAGVLAQVVFQPTLPARGAT